MSLFVSKEKQKALIPVGKTEDKYIYYKTGVPKADRIKTLSFKESIESIPFLDLAHNQRSASYISGVSGSGKSTKAVEIIKHLRKLRKDPARPVYVFTSSQLDNPDPVFIELAEKQNKNAHFQIVPLTSDVFKRVTLDDLHDSICVFDDWEAITDKSLERYTAYFIKDLLERSRKLGVDIIIINHMSQNYFKTRNIIFECDTYYLNIQMNKNSAVKFLKAYMEFTPKELEQIAQYEADNDFSFSVFRKSAPSYYIQDNKIKLL